MSDYRSHRTWYVEEVETGAIDGWYASQRYMPEVLASWNRRRPQYQHVVKETRRRFYLHDGIFLPVIHHREDGFQPPTHRGVVQT